MKRLVVILAILVLPSLAVAQPHGHHNHGIFRSAWDMPIVPIAPLPPMFYQPSYNYSWYQNGNFGYSNYRYTAPMPFGPVYPVYPQQQSGWSINWRF